MSLGSPLDEQLGGARSYQDPAVRFKTAWDGALNLHLMESRVKFLTTRYVNEKRTAKWINMVLWIFSCVNRLNALLAFLTLTETS